MRLFLSFCFCLFYLSSFSQNVDTIINTGFYKSYFSYHYKCPLYVSYNMYKAGGECTREKFRFKNDIKMMCATDKDYLNSGYDAGHLANAEDFAFDCYKEEKTFRYYNCLPQTPNLNRGVWKKWEGILRKISQNKKIAVICGGVFNEKCKKIGDNVYVPKYCWKVVIDLETNKTLHILIFENDDDSKSKEVTLKYLETMLGYKINLDTNGL